VSSYHLKKLDFVMMVSIVPIKFKNKLSWDDLLTF